LSTIINQNLYNVSNNIIELLGTSLFSGTNSDIYKTIINDKNNPNTSIQEVRKSNQRKNFIIKTLLIAIVKKNRTINNTVKIMLDLALLPVGPSTVVITRENPPDRNLVRIISCYSITELSVIKNTEYVITETDNTKYMLGMDIGDEIQLKFKYNDPASPTASITKNLVYIKKTDNYSYEIKELDSNIIITNKEEIVTNEVTISYLNRQFTYYYVLGSFASNSVIEYNITS
jgi:hypothetical protein